MKQNKRMYWFVLFGALLLAVSVAVYGIHYMIFHDWHHIFIYLIGDIAFVPLEVILVTLVFHRFILRKEQNVKTEKLNAIVGVFFSKVGASLLGFFSKYDKNYERTRYFIEFDDTWTTKDFDLRIKQFKRYKADVDTAKIPVRTLYKHVKHQEALLLQVFGNADMLDSKSLAYLFHTLFHLIDILDEQKRSGKMTMKKLDTNIDKLYTYLIYRWLHYGKHISEHYPHHYPIIVSRL